MAEHNFTVSAPYVRQIKEQSYEQGPSGAYDQLTDLPGFLEICVDVNGAPWVLARRKAPGLLADIARQATSQATPQPQAAPSAPVEQPPAEQPPAVPPPQE